MRRSLSRSAALILSGSILAVSMPAASLLSSSAEAASPSVTITVYDADTGKLFTETDLDFSIIGSKPVPKGLEGMVGGAILLGGWNTADTNPYTLTDIGLTDPESWNFHIQGVMKNGDSFSYNIDESKSKQQFSFADGLEQNADIYIKRSYWSQPATEPVTTAKKHNLGDVNGDDSFGIADAVLFQRWLLSVPDTELPDWEAADMNCDKRLDIFDFCIMKEELIKRLPAVNEPIVKGTKQLTLNDVITLSAKGDELTWSDFEDYKSTDIGSGIYIEKYDLEDDFTLIVGGLPERAPDFISLFHHGKDKEAIDIRNNDIQKYLDSELLADAAAMDPDTTSIKVSLDPEGKAVRLYNEQNQALISMLKQFTIIERSDWYMAASSLTTTFTLTDKSDRTVEFGLIGNEAVINGRGYTCNEKIYDNLRSFAHEVLSTNPTVNEFANPLAFDSFQKAECRVMNYDETRWILEENPSQLRNDYKLMYSRIKADGYIPTINVDAEKVDTAPVPVSRIILFPGGNHEDIGVGYYVKYNGKMYNVVYYYADTAKSSDTTDITAYLSQLSGKRSDKTAKIGSYDVSFTLNNEQISANAFVDDTHYFNINTNASEKELTAFIEALSFGKSSFEKKLMTPDDVIRLSKKGDEIRITDFAEFEYLADFCAPDKLAYAVDGTTFVVMVDAAEPGVTPQHFTMFSAVDSYGETVDVMKEDMESFFADPWFKVY